MSAVFGFFHHLFAAEVAKLLDHVHFWLGTLGGLVLVVSLYFLPAGNPAIEPVTAIASMVFFLGTLLFAWFAVPVINRTWSFTLYLMFLPSWVRWASLSSAIVAAWGMQLKRIEALGLPYALTLVAGAAVGGFGAGTLNLWLSGEAGVGHSVVGALAGAILAIEIYKWRQDLRVFAGLIFVPALAVSAGVGRIGCYLAGLSHNIYGIATKLPWVHDFGEGISRHPVQFYESISILVLLALCILLLAMRQPFFMRNGFYVLVLSWSVQRFVWEFLKAYRHVLSPFNLFILFAWTFVLTVCGWLWGDIDGRIRKVTPDVFYG
jgi:phosphatidylglycerol:prolipoprotein diacylglycerol transferase